MDKKLRKILKKIYQCTGTIPYYKSDIEAFDLYDQYLNKIKDYTEKILDGKLPDKPQTKVIGGYDLHNDTYYAFSVPVDSRLYSAPFTLPIQLFDVCTWHNEEEPNWNELLKDEIEKVKKIEKVTGKTALLCVDYIEELECLIAINLKGNFYKILNYENNESPFLILNMSHPEQTDTDIIDAYEENSDKYHVTFPSTKVMALADIRIPAKYVE